jgi:diguanylate cyclase (GGDEF)-like protein
MSLNSVPQPVRRVLLADDDASTRLLGHSVLSGAGFQVFLATNGEEAVESMLRDRPQMVLLDLEMPGVDGYEACRRIRHLPGGVDVPIVVVTSLDDPNSIERAYAAGATDFVTKPINWVLLVHRVRYVLRAADSAGALRAAEARNQALLRAMPDSLFLLDSAGRIQACAAGGGALPGDAPGRESPTTLAALLPPDAALSLPTLCAQALSSRLATTLECQRLQQGVTQVLEVRLLPNEDGTLLAVVRDVSEQKFSEQRIRRLAYYDNLTDLPNREWMEMRLTSALLAAGKVGGRVAVLFIDLDLFRRVNDTLGQLAGDAVLIEAADRLRRCLANLQPGVEDELPLARLGADEFLVWLPLTDGPASAVVTADMIRQAFEPLFPCGPVEVKATASIGVACYPADGQDVSTLLRNADAAAEQAKAAGRNRVVVYRAEMNSRALERLSLEADLRRALASNSLEVYYQPKYRVDDLGLVGAEALLRWKHPRLGFIPPNEFIGLAEAAGFIVDIDRWVVKRVCEDISLWRAAGKRLLPVAVNLSAQEFLNQSVVAMITDAAAQAEVPHGLLELELTESALVHDATLARELLTQLRDAGFTLAIDDFGTGYSSLQYLRRFPVHTLKIDRSFIRGAPDEREACALIRAVIQFAHSLDLSVVAEGVENYRQLDLLRAEGCDYLQGYLMDPALPPATYAAML